MSELRDTLIAAAQIFAKLPKDVNIQIHVDHGTFVRLENELQSMVCHGFFGPRGLLKKNGILGDSADTQMEVYGIRVRSFKDLVDKIQEAEKVLRERNAEIVKLKEHNEKLLNEVWMVRKLFNNNRDKDMENGALEREIERLKQKLKASDEAVNKLRAERTRSNVLLANLRGIESREAMVQTENLKLRELIEEYIKGPTAARLAFRERYRNLVSNGDMYSGWKQSKGPMMSFDTESRGYITASEIRQGRKDLHAKIFGIESHKIDVAIGGQDYALSVRIEKK